MKTPRGPVHGPPGAARQVKPGATCQASSDTQLLARVVASALSRPAESLQAADLLLDSAALKPAQRSDVLKARAVAQMVAGDLPAAMESVHAAIACAQEANDPVRHARCLSNLGLARATANQPLEALQAYTDALRLVGPASEVAAIVCSNIGLLAKHIGEDELALHFHRQALQAMPPSQGRAVAALNCGVSLNRLHRPAEARPYLIEAMEGTASGPDHTYHLNATAALAWTDGLEGRHALSCRSLEQVIERSEAAGLALSALRARMLLGEVLHQAGHDTAATRIGEACLLQVAEQAPTIAPELPVWLAQAHAALGDWQRAAELLLNHERARAAATQSATRAALRQRLFSMAAGDMCALLAPGRGPPRYALAAGVAKHLGLSTADAEMLRLITLGQSNPQIAQQLGQSAHTVRNRLSRVMRKLQVNTRTAASRRALELGLVCVDRAEEGPAAKD